MSRKWMEREPSLCDTSDLVPQPISRLKHVSGNPSSEGFEHIWTVGPNPNPRLNQVHLEPQKTSVEQTAAPDVASRLKLRRFDA